MFFLINEPFNYRTTNICDLNTGLVCYLDFRYDISKIETFLNLNMKCQKLQSNHNL